MKKLVILVCMLAALSTKTFSDRAYGEPDHHGENGAISYPGEFEKQQAVWMQWPPDLYNAGDQPVYPVMINVLNLPRLKSKDSTGKDRWATPFNQGHLQRAFRAT